MRLAVKVVPKASRPGLVGWMGEALKVRVAAAPEGGRANEAVRDALASALQVAPDRVRIVAGHASPRKIFEIDGLDDAEARRRIAAALGSRA
jgi:uncharacterized protein YggU (UPF0235/DUF167 family)